MKPLWVALFCSLCLLARAEDATPTAPPLSQGFPFDPQPGQVRLRLPLLINDHTILAAGILLKSISVDQNGGMRLDVGGSDGGKGGGGGGRHHHRQSADDGSSAAASSAGGTATGPAAATDGGKKNKDGDTSEVWTDIAPFQEALDASADYDKTLVYATLDSPATHKARIDLPDGMLLTEADGHVRLLGLTSNSKALQSGAKPGDEIHSLQVIQSQVPHPITSLADFETAYRAIQKESAATGKSYTLEVWRPSEGKTVTLRFSAVPSLNSSFL